MFQLHKIIIRTSRPPLEVQQQFLTPWASKKKTLCLPLEKYPIRKPIIKKLSSSFQRPTKLSKMIWLYTARDKTHPPNIVYIT